MAPTLAEKICSKDMGSKPPSSAVLSGGALYPSEPAVGAEGWGAAAWVPHICHAALARSLQQPRGLVPCLSLGELSHPCL